MGQLQADGLTWILDRNKYPDEKISEETIFLARQYEEDKEANLNSYKEKMAEFAENYVQYEIDKVSIMCNLNTTEAQKQAYVDNLIEPIKPRFESSTNPLTTSMEKRRQETKIQQMKSLSTASKALEIIKKVPVTASSQRGPGNSRT
jgi:hypothetical protein